MAEHKPVKKLVWDKGAWSRGLRYWSEATHKSVRAELVTEKREALIKQGLSWEKAEKLALDPDIYAEKQDGVEVGYKDARFEIPQLATNEAHTLAYLFDTAVWAGREAAGKVEEAQGTWKVGSKTPDGVADAAFDAEVAKSDERSEGKRRFTSDRVIGRILWTQGFNVGWYAVYTKTYGIKQAPLVLVDGKEVEQTG